MMERGQEPPTFLASQSDFLVRTLRAFPQRTRILGLGRPLSKVSVGWGPMDSICVTRFIGSPPPPHPRAPSAVSPCLPRAHCWSNTK